MIPNLDCLVIYFDLSSHHSGTGGTIMLMTTCELFQFRSLTTLL